MIFNKENRYKIYLETMEKEMRKLEAGDLSGLRFVYSAFAAQDQKLIKRAGEAVRQQLSSMTSMQLLRLCERFRTFTSLEWSIDWAEVSPERIQRELPREESRYVLLLGSFHPNGYFREKCVYTMAEFEGMLFWFFPRMNDWVSQVRNAASEVLEHYLETCSAHELLDSLPAYERLQAGRRRTENQMRALENRVEERLSCVLREVTFREISDMEHAARKVLYKIAIHAGFWNLQEMEECLCREKSTCLKGILIKDILARPDCTLEWAERYLEDTSSQVRRLAVEFRYERLKTGWPGLDRMLLDRSRGVREYASYILEKHGGFHIREYYLEHMKDDRPEYAILGLAEYCRNGNVQAFLDCLKRPERRILKCTLLALGCQVDFTDGELLWIYLLDDRIELSKAAYLSIRKKEFHMGAKRIYEAYLEAEAEHQKRYLLKLLLRESSWTRLPYLLRLYRRNMPEQERRQILWGIHSRFMYAKVSDALRGEILFALDECRKELPAGIENAILYDLRFLSGK